MMMRWVGLVWIAAGAACGDDGVTARDATTTSDAVDAVFVPGDVATTPDAVDVEETVETTADVPTDAGVDVAMATETVGETVGDTGTDTGVVETSVSDAPVDTTTLAPLGDDCTRPRALADPDEDRHYDALGDLGVAAGLADDLDASACGVTDASVNGQGKVDEVWRFVAPATGEYKVAALSDTNIDIVVYVLALSGDGTCGACVGFTDSGGAGDIDERVVALAAGDTVAIVVDGKTTAHAGAYLVDVYACEGPCE